MKAGDVVVVVGHAGVFRVERIVEGQVRCFSYVDGSFVVVDAALVTPCPPMTRAAP